MVWAGITATAKTPLFFIENGTKINQVLYRNLLNDHVLPWAQSTYGNENWVFQQDSAPAHTAKLTIGWIKENFPFFISPNEWPPNSPDLIPMDFSIWSILEQKACATSHKSVNSLKLALKKAWDEIDESTLKKIVDQFPMHLKLCFKAIGGYVE